MESRKVRKIPTHKKSSYLMLASCYNHFPVFGEKINIRNMVDGLKEQHKKQTQSRILKTILNLTLKKQNYRFSESYMLIDLLLDKKEKDFLKEKGVFIARKLLFIHTGKGIRFLKRVFSENNEIVSPAKIYDELKNDGNFYLQEVEAKNSGKFRRITHEKSGRYLVFDWESLEKDYNTLYD